MAQCTLTTPNQHKVRCQSARRYIVVIDKMHDAWIHKRSDNLDTARALAHREGGPVFIYDTVKQEIVK